MTQTAVDSLTDDRDWKERVAVVSPSTVGPVSADDDVPEYEPSDSFKRIDLPSYTVLDIPARMWITDEGNLALVVPLMAQDIKHVEISNLHVVGNPRFGMFLQSVRNLRLENVTIEMTDAASSGSRARTTSPSARSTSPRCSAGSSSRITRTSRSRASSSRIATGRPSASTRETTSVTIHERRHDREPPDVRRPTGGRTRAILWHLRLGRPDLERPDHELRRPGQGDRPEHSGRRRRDRPQTQSRRRLGDGNGHPRRGRRTRGRR